MYRAWPGLLPYRTMFKGLLIHYYMGFILASLPNPDVGFGLTSPSPIQADLLNKVMRESIGPARTRRRKVGLCHHLGLRGRQHHLCGLEAGIPGALAQAIVMSVVQCKHQFQYERWNCSTSHRVNTLRKGFKETAYMYAVTSAGLVHSFSRACSMGSLQRCTCDVPRTPREPRMSENTQMSAQASAISADSRIAHESGIWSPNSPMTDHPSTQYYHPRGFSQNSQLFTESASMFSESSRIQPQGSRILDGEDVLEEKWSWGGCGDNIQFGQKFTKKFLSARGSDEDLRAKVDLHNSNVGIKMIRDGIKVKCKCQGVSGSCAAKICWRQLSSFHEIGARLKKKYNRARKVALSANQVRGQSHLVLQPERNLIESRTEREVTSSSVTNAKLKRPGKRDLAYLEKSPNFCKRTKYSSGVSGRLCKNKDSCDDFCCGLGYNVQTFDKRRACNCRMEGEGCCNVKCDICVETIETFMCKQET